MFPRHAIARHRTRRLQSVSGLWRERAWSIRRREELKMGATGPSRSAAETDFSGKASSERRYFISSHATTDAAFLAQGVRGHWAIENGLHWCLDVGMREDECRLRVDHAAENFSRLRRIALNKLKRWEIRKKNGKVMQAGIPPQAA